MPRCFLERAVHVERMLIRWREPEDEAAEQRDSQREAERCEVQIHVSVIHDISADVTGDLRLDPAHTPEAKERPCHAAEEKQQKGFREE